MIVKQMRGKRVGWNSLGSFVAWGFMWLIAGYLTGAPQAVWAVPLPIIDYHFDECEYTGVGYEIIDSRGSYPAKAIGGVTTESSGQVGRFADVQTIAQNILPEKPIPLGNKWSVSVWFKTPFSGSHRYRVLGSVSGGGDLMYLDRNQNYRWGVYTDKSKDQLGSYTFGGLADGWHHLVLVGASNKTTLYVDGKSQKKIKVQTRGSLAYIGTSYDYYGGGSAQGFGAPLDEFMVFNVALSNSEVKSLFTNQKAGNNYDNSSRSKPQCGPFLPVAEYRLDECLWDGTTGEVIDSSGNNLHGTAVLSPVSIDISGEDGGVCRAASMGGVSHLAIPDHDLLDMPDTLTAMVWVRPDSIPTSGIKSILSKDTNYEFHIDSNGQLYWWWTSSGTAYTLTTTNASIVPGSWYHVTTKFDSGTATIYINGVPSISGSGYPATLDTNSDPLQIGGDYIGSRYFAGVIDEVLIYNSALDDTSLQGIYKAQRNDNNFDDSTRICPACGELSDTIVLSTNSSGGQLGSPAMSLDYADLIKYTVSSKTAAMVEALGSNFTRGQNQVNGAHIARDGAIFFSPEGNAAATDGTAFGPDDILKYDPRTRVLTRFLDGDSHFSNNGEKIDALFLLDNGNIILSTSGAARLGGLTFEDEDLVEYNPASRTASLYFDGSLHFTGDEDISGVHVIDSGRMLLSTESDAQLGGLSFKAGDIVLYTTTPHVGSVFFNGINEFGSVQNIDSITTASLDVTIDHYEIRHDGSALTCTPEEIQVMACLVSDCSELSTTSATLTLTPSGWDGGDEVTFTGSSDLLLRHTTPEVITLGMSNPVPVATNGYKCVDFIGGPSVSCAIEFFDSGFDFSVPTQVSGKGSDPITITAVRKDETGTRCVPAFVNRTETINFWSSYAAPATGSLPLLVNGTEVAAAAPGTGISLSFDASGQSTFTVLYSDAGQVTLDARFEGAGDEAGLEMTGNSSFVVHPAGLCTYSDAADSDCASGDGSCSRFVVAGTPFPLKVKGVVWENDAEADSDFCDTNATTPNYQHVGITLSHNLVAPLSGISGSLGITSVDIVAAGEVSVAQVVSEVGVFTFTADPPADYLGAGDVFGGATFTSVNVGRFIPDHFDVTILPDPPLFAETCLVYTYLGQPFDWESVPELTITAMNGAASPVATVNYEADFWKLDTSLNYSYLDNNVPPAAAPLTPQTSSQNMEDTTDCGGSVIIPLIEDDGIAGNGLQDGFIYSRPAPDSPVSPFEPDVTMSVSVGELTDSDGVCLKGGSGCQGFQVAAITGIHVNHGRALAEAVFGPETEALVMPVTGYLYDGTEWKKNGDDDCTTFDYSMTFNGITVTSLPAGTVTLIDGSGDLTMTPAVNSNRGTVSVSFDFPDWLHPDPAAVATFGISRGNDRILNWQEINR